MKFAHLVVSLFRLIMSIAVHTSAEDDPGDRKALLVIQTQNAEEQDIHKVRVSERHVYSLETLRSFVRTYFAIPEETAFGIEVLNTAANDISTKSILHLSIKIDNEKHSSTPTRCIMGRRFNLSGSFSINGRPLYISELISQSVRIALYIHFFF